MRDSVAISYQPFIDFSSASIWNEVKDGHPDAVKIFSRHYSKYHYKDGRKPKRFVGPGHRMVLLSTCGKALFVWRKFKSKDEQDGVNCSIFRNESEHLSSWLIEEAVKLARIKWPGERLYTYVNPRRVRSTNAGYCFKKSGWKMCGIKKKKKTCNSVPGLACR